LLGSNFQLIIIGNRSLCFPKILPPGKAALSDLHLHLTLRPGRPPAPECERVRAGSAWRIGAVAHNCPSFIETSRLRVNPWSWPRPAFCPPVPARQASLPRRTALPRPGPRAAATSDSRARPAHDPQGSASGRLSENPFKRISVRPLSALCLCGGIVSFLAIIFS